MQMYGRSGAFPVRGVSKTVSDRHRSRSGTVVGIDGQLAALVYRHLPGQERSDVGRGSAAVLGTAVQIPGEPTADVELGQGQRRKQGEQRRRQPAAP